MPVMAPASSTFGVTTVASGKRLLIMTCTPFASRSGAPEDERMIGSSTTYGILADFRKIATTSTSSAEPSMPMRTAEIVKSDDSSRSVSVTSLAATGSTLRTEAVDWTVKAVMHPIPKQLWAARVLMSAVTPAPDEGSNPAMLRTMGGFGGINEWETSNRNLDEISGDARTIASCSICGAEFLCSARGTRVGSRLRVAQFMVQMETCPPKGQPRLAGSEPGSCTKS